ncbi:hypothetical protein PYCCODRAFT_282643 [Trametes coccinea BRFM310]|uniref:Uncharacterized protein n=1 Tax=Trametes coccinea (strain BRFM310) TaxID=1353009 RepID=A0A1Y2IPI0_TRAC3|nr:hypothetical protein PYCCODRAFT_282643 [Trametes coccinea BRFM310]
MRQHTSYITKPNRRHRQPSRPASSPMAKLHTLTHIPESNAERTPLSTNLARPAKLGLSAPRDQPRAHCLPRARPAAWRSLPRRLGTPTPHPHGARDRPVDRSSHRR